MCVAPVLRVAPTGARDDAQATIGAFGETQIRGALPDERVSVVQKAHRAFLMR